MIIQWDFKRHQMLLDNHKEYNGLLKFTEGMKNLFSDVTSVRILDVGAGTGLSGQKLLNLGYTNVDGLEPCESFFDVLQEKGIYRNVIHTPIGGEVPLPVADDTYDAVCMAGSFGPGSIPCAAINEMVRIVKPGGYILNCMREEWLYLVPEYKGRLLPLLEQLEQEGQIRRLEWSTYPDHFYRKDGIRMVFQVTKGGGSDNKQTALS